MTKLMTALIAVAMFALGAGIFHGGDVAPATAPAPSVQYDAPIALPFSVATEPGKASLATPVSAPIASPVERGNEMGRQLLTAKNIKEFATDALRHPEQGGAYYANLAVAQCDPMEPKDNLLRRIEERDGKVSPELLAKVSLVRDRCDGLTQDDADSIKKTAKQLGAEGKDPILATQLRLRQAQANKDTVEYNRLRDELIRSGSLAYASEINALDHMLTEKTTFGDDGTKTLIFNGKIYTDPTEIFGLSLAAQISLCSERDYCWIDTEMAATCRNSGTCYASRDAYWQQWTKDKPPQLMEYVTRYSEVMRAAIARGDASIFR